MVLKEYQGPTNNKCLVWTYVKPRVVCTFAQENFKRLSRLKTYASERMVEVAIADAHSKCVYIHYYQSSGLDMFFCLHVFVQYTKTLFTKN